MSLPPGAQPKKRATDFHRFPRGVPSSLGIGAHPWPSCAGKPARATYCGSARGAGNLFLVLDVDVLGVDYALILFGLAVATRTRARTRARSRPWGRLSGLVHLLGQLVGSLGQSFASLVHLCLVA